MRERAYHSLYGTQEITGCGELKAFRGFRIAGGEMLLRLAAVIYASDFVLLRPDAAGIVLAEQFAGQVFDVGQWTTSYRSELVACMMNSTSST